MTTNEQGGMFLRLRQDKRDVDIELAALRPTLRQFGETMQANAKILLNDPLSWRPDVDWFCSDLRSAVENANRLRELSAKEEVIQTEIDRFETAGL